MSERSHPRLVVLAELRAVDVVDVEPAGVAAHAGVAAAWELLERSGCEFVPVVRGGRVVGVIEEATLAAASTGGGLRRPERAGPDGVVPVVVRASAPLAEVVAAVRRTPTELTLVVDDEGRLIGAISTERLITLLDGAMETP